MRHPLPPVSPLRVVCIPAPGLNECWDTFAEMAPVLLKVFLLVAFAVSFVVQPSKCVTVTCGLPSGNLKT